MKQKAQTFLMQQVRKSGMTQVEVANKMGFSKQAFGWNLRHPRPNPATVALVLKAIGWTGEQIAALPLGEVYPEIAAQ